MRTDYTQTMESPSAKFVTITPHVTNAVPGGQVRAIYIGGEGTLTVRGVDDSDDQIFVGLTAGMILPIMVTHVRASGTTATNLVGLV